MVQVEIVLILVLHLILHGVRDTILICDADLVLCELTVLDSQIFLIKHVSLLRKRRQVYGYIVHLRNVLSVLDYTYS